MRIVYPKPEEILFYEGPCFAVEWYYTENGRLPTLEYYRRLAEAEQHKLKLLVKYLADNPHGTQLPVTMYRIEDRENKIFAFKPRAERFFNFMTEGSLAIITNAYHKHAQKMTKQDMEGLRLACRYRQDYIRRVKEGTYYEA
ncbi:MAG: hypothetical protein NTY77_16470 [Elusimicrobia bacterium]|nr:hypothetical protein [Elusimicrobiota bacterium]